MKTGFLKAAGPGLLVARPNGVQYGHLGLEILMSLAHAKALGAALCLLKPRRVVSEALFDLDSDDVRIVQPGPLTRWWLRSSWALRDARAEWRLWRERTLEVLRDETGKELSRHILDPELPGNLRDRLKRIKGDLVEKTDDAPPASRDAPPYLRRRLIRDPIRVFLRAEILEGVRRAAVKCGIDPEAKLVTIHAREPGYKRGMEVQEKHRRLGKAYLRDDSVRNARIETYFDAIDFLMAHGYTVVRIGDPTMTPTRRQGIVDLATSPWRTQALEVFCLLASDFLISGEAGPVGVSYLTNTPVVNIGATDPISSYPVRRDGIYLLKRVVDRATGRELKLADMLTETYMGHIRDSSRYRYVDNTPLEILEAVAEMIEGLRKGWCESDAQIEYRERVTQAGVALRTRLSYVRKWGPDEGFLGDGRIARSYIERRL